MIVKQRENQNQVCSDSRVMSELLAFCEQRRWGAKVLGQMGPISEPVISDDMRYVRLENEQGYVPLEAYRRIEAVEKRATVVQKLIGHEIPKQDGLFGVDPTQARTAHRVPREEPARPTAPSHLPTMPNINVEKIVAFVVLAIMAVVTGLGYLFAMGLAVDPNAVVVIRDENGTHWWLEVANWPQ